MDSKEAIQKRNGVLPKGKEGSWRRVGTLRTLKRPYPIKGTGAWDEGNPREAADVRHEARLTNLTVHFGRICELCHEKGSELADGDPGENERARRLARG